MHAMVLQRLTLIPMIPGTITRTGSVAEFWLSWMPLLLIRKKIVILFHSYNLSHKPCHSANNWVEWYGIHIILYPCSQAPPIEGMIYTVHTWWNLHVSRVRLVLYFSNWSYNIFHMIGIKKKQGIPTYNSSFTSHYALREQWSGIMM